MNEMKVRLQGIILKNFKNVVNGQLDFINTRKNFKASILGLYGQNGSGKTALIDAIELLQYLLMGQRIPKKFADYIHLDSQEANIQYKFRVMYREEKYEVLYDVTLKGGQKENIQNIETGRIDKEIRVVVESERLSYFYEGSEKKNINTVIIDTSLGRVFGPDSEYECLIGKEKDSEINVFIAKMMTRNDSRSFLFSKELLTVIRDKVRKRDEEYIRHTNLMESLVNYGNFELFVINAGSSGIISMNALPIVFKYKHGVENTLGNIMIPLEGTTTLLKKEVKVVKHVVDIMNIVLPELVPGLTIHIKELGSALLQDGGSGRVVQLVSKKNQREIPLRYESDGIKKIVSILQLLIVVYNNESLTVAIDELDAGIFEYLLGELLRILSEKGKGQLIFTSHNLRPLETIDRGFVAFTTTDSKNRYTGMNDLEESNNLRDYYYRKIVLGSQDEEFYTPTNNAEIALAFREAGEVSGS